MFSFGYRDRKWRIFKDIVFVIVAVVLILRAGFWGILIGALALLWYGWDLYTQLRAMKLEKEAEKVQSSPASPADDGKITVTDGAREVNYEKE
jgi:uncharacterized membrane protein